MQSPLAPILVSPDLTKILYCIHSLQKRLFLLLTGEIDRPSTERVEPVRGCLITQAVWNEPP
jgi:hypothetical protein